MINLIVSTVFYIALAITFITDYKFFLIYRAVTIFLIPPLFLLAYYSYTPVCLLSSIYGALIGYISLWLVKIGYSTFKKKEGIGQGDLELLATIGAYTGPLGVWYSLMLGSCCGSIYALVMIALKRADTQTHLPFGSFLVGGCILYLWLFPYIIANDTYIALFVNS